MNENHELSPHLEGQVSINDFLPSSPAVVPVAVREPTDEELVKFLSNESSVKRKNRRRLSVDVRSSPDLLLCFFFLLGAKTSAVEKIGSPFIAGD